MTSTKILISCITLVLALLSCQRNVVTSPTSNSGSSTSITSTPPSWSSSPNSSSSKIRVLTDQPQAILNGVLAVGLPQMGFTITKNTGSFLETNSITAETESVKVKAWVDEQSIIITSEVESFEQSDFGLPVSQGFVNCTKGTLPYGSECWRTLSMVASHIEGEKSYQ